MSNTAHYQLEADLKDKILRMDHQALKNRLYEFVDIAPVATVERLAEALGVRPSLKV